jgi:hypothetical protein
MNEIKTIHTVCKHCVFSIFDNNTQTGCFTKYLDRYRDNHEEILEVFDDNKEFYVINNKKCLGYREKSWFDQFNMLNSSIEEKFEKIKKENKLQYLLVIDLQQYNLEDLDDLESQLKALETSPSKIIFIRYDNNTIHSFERLDQILKSCDLHCPWRIQSMLDYSLSYDEILHTIIFIENKYRFILSVYKPYKSINNIIVKANKIVFENLGQFNVISDDNKSCLLFSGGIYRYCAFHEHKDILKDFSNHIIV